MYSALIRASQTWLLIALGELEVKQIDELRRHPNDAVATRWLCVKLTAGRKGHDRMFAKGREMDAWIASHAPATPARLWRWVVGRDRVIVYGLIVGVGVLEILLSYRSDFFREDVGYIQRGLSLLHQHFDGVDGVPETTQPPGFALIVAAVSATFGSTFPVFLHCMAVFNTLALLATYELFRREEGRVLAAAVCVLLATSDVYFSLATQVIYPCYPYVLAAALALLVAKKTDELPLGRSRSQWVVLTTLLVVSALLIESRGIALLCALSMWMGISFFTDHSRAATRLMTFLPVLVIGFAVQGWWMLQASPVSDWGLPGYPASYFSQVMLKQGYFPELGTASIGDLFERLGGNLIASTALLGEIISRHWINPSWSSPAIAGVIVLMLLGVGYSLVRTGGRLMDWYFVFAASIVLVWPFGMGIRFVLPSIPFAALYCWRGVEAVRRAALLKPRLVGLAAFLVSAALGSQSLRAWDGVESGVQADLALLGWLAINLGSLWMLWSGRPPFVGQGLRLRRHSWNLAALTVLVLALVGISQEVRTGLQNIRFTVDDLGDPDIAAAKWIDAHTPIDAVVLARKDFIVRYYSHRKVYWFPPVSRPEVLLDGIRKRNVDYVVIIRKPRYQSWFPSDQDCFERLLNSRPGAVSLVTNTQDFGVYEVRS